MNMKLGMWSLILDVRLPQVMSLSTALMKKLSIKEGFCFLMTLVFGVFLQAAFSYFAGRCRFFCKGGSQVWVKEKVGETNGKGGLLIWILQGFLQNADSLSQAMK